MRGLKEIVLYGHLISEACTPIIKSASVPSIQISPDGGRYKKSESEELRKILHRTFSGAFGSETKLKVAFQSSHDSAGIQIADVIANTVYQYQSGSGSAALCGEITSNLIALERLELRTLQLEVIRPAWMPATKRRVALSGRPLKQFCRHNRDNPTVVTTGASFGPSLVGRDHVEPKLTYHDRVTLCQLRHLVNETSTHRGFRRFVCIETSLVVHRVQKVNMVFTSRGTATETFEFAVICGNPSVSR